MDHADSSEPKNEPRATLVKRQTHNMKTETEYEKQAADFLTRNGLKFRATLSDSKAPAWSDDGKHGHHYRITLSRPSIVPAGFPVQPLKPGEPATKRATCGTCGLSWDDGISTSWTPAPSGRCPFEYFHGAPTRLVFDFWGSIADAEKLDRATFQLKDYNWRQDLMRQEWESGVGKQLPDLDVMQANIRAQYQREIAEATPSAYDVLSCISSDAHTPETFGDFCSEYGYETDSIRALQLFRRCSAFAKRLRAFFTESELEQLSEIQ